MVFLWSLRRCFPTSIQRKILRGSTINPGINKCKFLNTAKISIYHSKTSWGIFVRHLAILEYSPCATNCLFCFRFRSWRFLGMWQIVFGFPSFRKSCKTRVRFFTQLVKILSFSVERKFYLLLSRNLFNGRNTKAMCASRRSHSGKLMTFPDILYFLITKDCYSDGSPSSWRITSYLFSTATNLTHSQLRSTPGSLIPGTWSTS